MLDVSCTETYTCHDECNAEEVKCKSFFAEEFRNEDMEIDVKNCGDQAKLKGNPEYCPGIAEAQVMKEEWIKKKAQPCCNVNQRNNKPVTWPPHQGKCFRKGKRKMAVANT